MSKENALFIQKLIAFVGVIFCSGLLVLSVPRFMASLYVLYPDAVLNQTQQLAPAEIYEKSIADINQALQWYPNPDYWKKLGFFYLKLFDTQPVDAEAQKISLLNQAQIAITKGLSFSPIDPQAWLKLAQIGALLYAPKPQIINDLSLSLYAGRVEPELVMTRLAFSYDFYNDFSEDMKKQWQKQLLLAWGFSRQAFIEFVSQHPELKPMVLQVFIHSPDDAQQFLSQYDQYVKTKH
jgi:tetratricopeptide (TPR) repeat protein